MPKDANMFKTFYFIIELCLHHDVNQYTEITQLFQEMYVE